MLRVQDSVSPLCSAAVEKRSPARRKSTNQITANGSAAMAVRGLLSHSILTFITAVQLVGKQSPRKENGRD